MLATVTAVGFLQIRAAFDAEQIVFLLGRSAFGTASFLRSGFLERIFDFLVFRCRVEVIVSQRRTVDPLTVGEKIEP